MTDGADAVLQAAFCAIQTPRYAHPIYSRQYGSELHTLIGRDREYVFSEGRRMITDALSVDPRILSVSGFRMDGDAIVFNIRTAYADTEIGIREGVLL